MGIAYRAAWFRLRTLHLLRTGYWHTGERVCPEFQDENFINHRKVYQFISQMVKGKHVLDVGCGTGYGTALLAEVADKATGIDSSRQAIRYAKRHYHVPEFFVMDAHKLEFDNESFDLVFSSENFEHLVNQQEHLREVRRVLKHDGVCFIATPNPEAFGGKPNPYHTKENTYDELLGLLRSQFREVVILENSRTPKQDRGLIADKDLCILGQHLSAEHLSNTHSFFCFMR